MIRARINRNHADSEEKLNVFPRSYNEDLHSSSIHTVFGVLLLCILLTGINFYELHRLQKPVKDVSILPKETDAITEKTFIVYGKNVYSGYLKHVFAVLNRLGYTEGDKESQWDVLWAHDYPFRALYPMLKHLDAHQKVNHFPGSGYITNKVDLATTKLKHIPPAFRMPQEKNKFLEFVQSNSHKIFVQKSNDHRGIKIRNISNIDFELSGTFVQEYISNPLLIDGFKFDIGVYTIITSINPLRVYAYKGDVLFRFCPNKYHPFDPQNLDKYVVGDDYLPLWDVPSMRKYYIDLNFSMKESFDAVMKSQGKDPSKMWKEVNEAIMEIVLEKEHLLIESASRYSSSENFFEMMRIDFVVDEDLNVFVMEANMSPNLSSAHFPQNRLLYEQVLFNLFSLVGIGIRTNASSLQSRSVDEELMQVSLKNVMVHSELCSSVECVDCSLAKCTLCKNCMSTNTFYELKTAYLEHVNRHDCQRVFPPTKDSFIDIAQLSPNNQWMVLWFRGKCAQDSSWCT